MEALTNLRNMGGYAPANEAYTVEAIAAKLVDMQEGRDAEVSAQAHLDTVRDQATAAEWEFHNAILGVKEQVIAQFGKDSIQLQALGLKRKSEYKAPTRKAKAA